MLQTPIIAIAAVVAASWLGAIGQYLIKAGADRSGGTWWAHLLSPWTLSGMGSYLLVMVLFTFAFRRGGTVMVLYPVYALTYVWAALIGHAVFGQHLRPLHFLGLLLLVLGMLCLGMGHEFIPEDTSS